MNNFTAQFIISLTAAAATLVCLCVQTQGAFSKFKRADW